MTLKMTQEHIYTLILEIIAFSGVGIGILDVVNPILEFIILLLGLISAIIAFHRTRSIKKGKEGDEKYS